MAQWHFWGEKRFSDVYENIYIRSFVEDWFKIIGEIVKEINSNKHSEKLLLDVGCGEGHTTKQILDRIHGKYTCDLLEPNINALASAKAFLTPENSVGECFAKKLSAFETKKKYDIIFTSHTNYYWALNRKDYNSQLLKLTNLLKSGGKLLILTLPKHSNHYKITLGQIYPNFNYAEYIINFYKEMKFNVSVKKLKMRIFVGDILTTKSKFDLKVFYKFIHGTNSFPNDVEAKNFLSKIKAYQKGGYIDFKDYLITISNTR